jgi:hypothetical protein
MGESRCEKSKQEIRIEKRDLRSENGKRWTVLASFSIAAKEGGWESWIT